MRKNLPADSITNELEGSSVFFTRPAVRKEDSARAGKKRNADAEQAGRISDATKIPSHHGSTIPDNHGTVVPSHRDTAADTTADTTTDATADSVLDTSDAPIAPSLLETVRQAVKHIGKEAATHRFSIQEKQQLADIVYTYGRQGLRTSENEITRIAVNWLLRDYELHGAHSVLARMLDALHG